LTWQGIAQPNSRNSLVTGTLTLCVGGTLQSYNDIHADSSGNFQLVAGLANGTYSWKMRGPRHLSATGTLTMSAGVANVELGAQMGGNANTDEVINATDFNLLRNSFGVGGDRPTDFNFDSVTNATDFNLLKANFGQSGSAMTCP
jgi:hypothetical protein